MFSFGEGPRFHNFDDFAVEVNDGSGLIRRGVVRKLVEDEGFIIDFGYPEHHADFVRIGMCLQPISYWSRFDRRSHTIGPGDVMEAVLQRNVDEPWSWYSAKIRHLDLRHPSHGYILVEVDMDGQMRKEVVLPTQLRFKWQDHDPMSLEHFKTHFVELPPGKDYLAITELDGFLGEWQRQTATIFLEISEGTLVYSSSMVYGNLVTEIVGFSFDAVAATLRKKQASNENTAQDRNLSSNDSQSVADGIGTLTRNILSEVLEYLDVVAQSKILRVCRDWNALLQATPTSARVEIDMNIKPYRFGVMLHKSVSASTKGLFITNSAKSTRKGSELMSRRSAEAIAVLKWNSIKLARILIRGNILKSKFSNIPLEQNRLSRLEKWRSVCKELVLENVDVTDDDQISHVKRAVVGVGQPVVPEEFLQKWVTG